nr:tyrosine-type recombinase/integrase [Actinomycetota bacterium]
GHHAYWRVRWPEEGRNKDTTATSRDAAVTKATAIVARLGRGVPTDRGRATGADLIAHYLDPLRRPPKTAAWSIRHRGEQERYCEKYVLPVLGRIKCSQVTSADLARVMARASTPSVADHLRRCVSALIASGVSAGYLLPGQCLIDDVAPLQAEAHAPDHDAAVMPEEVPPDDLVHELARAAARLRGVWWRELELLLTAYSGLRFGEHAALLARRVDFGRCRVTVAQQVVEADGGQTLTMPKGRKRRLTVYPQVTPCGVDLASMVERRINEVGPDGLLFPAPKGGWLRRSNFGRNIWTPAAESAAWPRDGNGGWLWTFHSLRHVFASWALGLPGVTIEDVSRFLGHSSPRVTADIYVHLTAAAFERFRDGSARAAAGVRSAEVLASEQLVLPIAV